jgi:hypothetical protein
MSNVIREGKSRDIVGLHERSIKQVAHGDRVPRLKANVVLACPNEGGIRNHGNLGEIAAFLRRPIKNHHRGCDLGQATNLPFFLGLRFFQDVAGLGVDDDRRFRGPRPSGRTQKEGENEERKRDFAQENDHGDPNRCTLTGHLPLATGNPLRPVFA